MPTAHAHAIGAAHEMIVAADLLKRGYFVYHQVSRGSAFDLVMSDGFRLWRVEVTTASIRPDQKVFCHAQSRDITRFDILACVRPDHSMTYAYSPHLDVYPFEGEPTILNNKRREIHLMSRLSQHGGHLITRT